MTKPSSIDQKLVLMYTLRHVNNCKHFRLATKHQLYMISQQKTSTEQKKKKYKILRLVLLYDSRNSNSSIAVVTSQAIPVYAIY